MPCYVYQCPKCKRTEELQRPIAYRDLDLPQCATCGSESSPQPMALIPAPPSPSFPGADSWRRG